MGVFTSEAAAKRALNDQIGPLWDKSKRDRPSCKRAEVGVEDVEWSHACVQRAVIGVGWHVHKLDDPHAIAREGAYFVDGHLNKKYKVGKKRRSNNFDDNGRHSVAVLGGKVKDSAFLPHGDISVTSLCNAKTKLGFMRSINRAYELVECSNVGCVACARATKKLKK